jgi:AcrR family transcriptional regulator
MTEGDGPALPGSIELAWGLRNQSTRGPRPGLTLDRIVAAGIKIALTQGLGALSMGRVANELGVSTMSLYRYVSAKDELLTLMVDTGLGSPPPVEAGADWRAGLTRWAIGVRASYQRHPWALRVPISGPPIGPNNVAWLDNALQCLANTPLTEDQKLSTVLLVSGHVRSEATLSADIAAAAGAQPVMPGYGSLLRRLTTAERFPALHRAIESGSLDDDDDLDTEFNFGLERILDGIESLIDRSGERPGGG